MSDKCSLCNEKNGSKFFVTITLVSVICLLVIFIMINEYNVADSQETLRQQLKSEQPAILIEAKFLEDSLLTTYEAVDSANAVYRIPINRAMELMAAEAENPGSQ